MFEDIFFYVLSSIQQASYLAFIIKKYGVILNLYGKCHRPTHKTDVIRKNANKYIK